MNGQSNKKKKKKTYINAQQKIPVQYGSTLHIPLTDLLLLAATQGPYKKPIIIKKY